MDTLVTQSISETNAAYALLGCLAGFGIFLLLLVLVLGVLSIIAMWKIFTKAGEKGWKSIIPIYNLYILYKISWKTSYFWILFIAAVVLGVIGAILGQNSMVYSVLSFGISLFELIITIILLHKLSKSFGHGAGFTVGLIFLNTIFTLILAFDNSEYNKLPENEVQTNN